MVLPFALLCLPFLNCEDAFSFFRFFYSLVCNGLFAVRLVLMVFSVGSVPVSVFRVLLLMSMSACRMKCGPGALPVLSAPFFTPLLILF